MRRKKLISKKEIRKILKERYSVAGKLIAIDLFEDEFIKDLGYGMFYALFLSDNLVVYRELFKYDDKDVKFIEVDGIL